MLKDIKEKCCGCGACADICPAHIISMQRNGLGFPYPHVDGEKCLNCNLCNSVCPNQKEKNVFGTLEKLSAHTVGMMT